MPVLRVALGCLLVLTLAVGQGHWSACIHHTRLAGAGSAMDHVVAATGATSAGED